MSKEVADRFVDALRKLEEEQDVEALVEIHTENCEVGNVAVPQTFEGHTTACASSGRSTARPSAR
jgi:hypothetical protein